MSWVWGPPGVRGDRGIPGASGPGSMEEAADEGGSIVEELRRSLPPAGLPRFPPFVHMVTRPGRSNQWHLQAGLSCPQNTQERSI